MDDANAAFYAVKATKKIVQMAPNVVAAIITKQRQISCKVAKYGPITMVELNWNVNQPGRWRRAALVEKIRQQILIGSAI
jgi:hypothetical protein